MSLKGDSIQRLYLTLTFLVLSALLAGCASSAVAQPAEVSALADPTATALPDQSQILGSPVLYVKSEKI